METHTERLADALERVAGGLLLVVTGAGASHASGIPTFRGTDPGAVWRESDVEIATHAFFRRAPEAQWRWYLRRFDALAEARPNAAHRALVALEGWQSRRGGDFLLITQNIDTLHEQAGSTRLVKVHGTSDRVRCSRPGCRLAAPAGSLPRDEVDLEGFRGEPTAANVPRCPECGEMLRAHVLLFDELYDEHRDYQFGRVQVAAERSALTLFVGTSFAVGVTDLLVRASWRRGAPMLSIDPAGARLPPGVPVTPLDAPAEELLPAVCARLGVAAGGGAA